MNTRLTNLISFYNEQTGPARRDDRCRDESKFISKAISEDYSVCTLRRLIFSRDTQIRRAAVWGLGWIGQHSECRFLGPLLRDPDAAIRFEADRAREQILLRVRSLWHRQFAEQIEDSMADSHWTSANRMVDKLVATHAEHPQTWLLRISVRMCTSQLAGAIEDCRQVLSIDRDCYRACVMLGQSYWFMQRISVAKECFLEAARIYPDCTSSQLCSQK